MTVFTQFSPILSNSLFGRTGSQNKGFPQAREALFPSTEVQSCIVHRGRKSLSYLSYKDPTDVVEDLNQLYLAAKAEEAARQLALLEAHWSALLVGSLSYYRQEMESDFDSDSADSILCSLALLLSCSLAFPH